MIVDVDYRIVDVDASTCLLFLTGNHRAFLIGQPLAARLRQGPELLQGSERREWDLLLDADLAGDENREVLRRAGTHDGADLAVNVNLTNVCNLACTYCFADGGDYGRITDAMGPESVDHIFRFVARHVTATRSVRFEFFGGEPLANWPIIREICERSERFGAQHGISFVHRISTNLTILPPEAPELFARFGFIVSVSIDGGRDVQDANRPAKGGQGSYDRVVRNARRVRDAGDGIIMVARMTVAQSEPSLLANVRLLWELNLFDYFQIYPGVYPEPTTAFPAPTPEPGSDAKVVFLDLPTVRGPDGSPDGGPGPVPDRRPRYVNHMLLPGMVEQFREFLHAYPGLVTPDNRFRGVLEYERTVQYVLEGALALAFCSGGRNYFTHSPDLSITSCHRLVGDTRHDVGTGPEGLTVEPLEWRRSVDDHPVCRNCWARYVCGGGCKQENFVASGDLNLLNPESCAYQLLLTEEVLRMLARSDPSYRSLDRALLDDLFVSCGRPTLRNGRAELSRELTPSLHHFRPLPPVHHLTAAGETQ